MSVLLQKSTKTASFLMKLNNLHSFSKLIGSIEPMLIMESPPCNSSIRNVQEFFTYILDIKYSDELSRSHLNIFPWSWPQKLIQSDIWKNLLNWYVQKKKNLGMYGTNVQEGWTKRSFLPDCHYCIIADCGVLRLGLKINYT